MLAFLALFSGGLITFFWKVAGANQVYAPSYMVVETLVFCLAAVLIHLIQRHPFDLSTRMTGLAALGGIAGAISVYAMLLAFRLGGQGSLLFPIAGLGVVVSVILSTVIYREPVTITKLLGLGLGVSSIIVLSR
jgi:uncharacterized membrane protein|tara:strand:+ start:453 stop:854 length:402 start_codon:yes stop_codon:yes gene_type:complete